MLTPTTLVPNLNFNISSENIRRRTGYQPTGTSSHAAKINTRFALDTMRLITIPISHYCEKARWALERLGLDYLEERHIQGFHYPRTWWSSHNLGVPVLIEGRRVIIDSTAILKHLEQYAPRESRLYPADSATRAQVEALEDRFDETLGVESRRWFYYHYLPRADESLRLIGQGVPAIERTLAPLMFPFMRRYAAWLLDVSERTVEMGIVRVKQVISQTDDILADGRPFLVGNHFSAADMTLACMMAPFVLPEEYGVQLPHPDSLPQPMRATVDYFRQTLTGQHALTCFCMHRHKPVSRKGLVY